jgi:hypothetical protein
MVEFAYEWTGSEVEHFNDPQLNSPHPCKHGAGCTYFGSCSFVHPGEEGTGRAIFEERVLDNGDGTQYTQPACVRLVGNAGFYRRRRAQMSWPEFCARNSIPYTPNPPRPRETNEVEGEAEPATEAAPRAAAPRGRGGRAHGPRVHSSYRGDGVVQQEQGRGVRREDVSGGAGSGRPWQGRGRGAPRGARHWVGLPSAVQQP